MTGNIPSRLVLFDGVCNLCNGVVKFIIGRDPLGRFSFASLQSEGAQEVLRAFSLPVDDLESFVYVREGRAYRRSSAALYVLRDIGGFWKLSFVFMIIPPPVRDMIYDLVARSRYRLFGRSDSCMLPTPDQQKRFWGTPL
jgi:predicted DCC family thiol-disulfide oxidoreductase YuxK